MQIDVALAIPWPPSGIDRAEGFRLVLEVGNLDEDVLLASEASADQCSVAIPA